jgi:hypothetical protein
LVCDIHCVLALTLWLSRLMAINGDDLHVTIAI